MTIKVLLVDDHQVIREGLRRILELDKEIQVVAEAASGEEALIQVENSSPDIVLMDIKMPGMGGIEAIRQLRRKHPRLNIIVLTVYGDQYLAEAIEAGASGYLIKDISRDELLQAIHKAYRGEAPLAPAITRTLITEYATLAKNKVAHRATLTQRQLQILRLIASGATNREIAAQLFISQATVKRETANIFAKLNVRDRAEAVSQAHKRNLL